MHHWQISLVWQLAIQVAVLVAAMSEGATVTELAMLLEIVVQTLIRYVQVCIIVV